MFSVFEYEIRIRELIQIFVRDTMPPVLLATKPPGRHHHTSPLHSGGNPNNKKGALTKSAFSMRVKKLALSLCEVP
jgi:hypothetical protein